MVKKIERLVNFIEKEKFGFLEWEKRGLNSSDEKTNFKMEALFNECATSLIASIESNKSQKVTKRLFKSGLLKFNKSDYDTEELEFICDRFMELSQIIDVDIKKELNVWLYGFVLSSFIQIISFLKK